MIHSNVILFIKLLSVLTNAFGCGCGYEWTWLIADGKFMYRSGYSVLFYYFLTEFKHTLTKSVSNLKPDRAITQEESFLYYQSEDVSLHK